MSQTEIRVRRLSACSAYSEPYWRADLVEGGEVVWPDCYGTSYVSEEDAKQKLLEKLEPAAALTRRLT